MNEFARQVLERLVAVPAEPKPIAAANDFVVQEPNWFEAAEERLLEPVASVDGNVMIDASDNLTAMQTKERCRKLLAQSGYRECGWPAVALFDHMLVAFSTGRDWMQPSGWANVPPETGYGLVPCLMVSNAALWAATYLNAVKAGDVEYAAKAACKLAYLMTVIFLACPHPRLREDDQPSAEALT
jgi:hypothetical protein